MTFNQFRTLIIEEVRSVFPKAKIAWCSKNIEEKPGIYFYFKIPLLKISNKEWKNRIIELRNILKKYQVSPKNLPFDPLETYGHGDNGYCFVAVKNSNNDFNINNVKLFAIGPNSSSTHWFQDEVEFIFAKNKEEIISKICKKFPKSHIVPFKAIEIKIKDGKLISRYPFIEKI